MLALSGSAMGAAAAAAGAPVGCFARRVGASGQAAAGGGGSSVRCRPAAAVGGGVHASRQAPASSSEGTCPNSSTSFSRVRCRGIGRNPAAVVVRAGKEGRPEAAPKQAPGDGFRDLDAEDAAKAAAAPAAPPAGADIAFEPVSKSKRPNRKKRTGDGTRRAQITVEGSVMDAARGTAPKTAVGASEEAGPHYLFCLRSSSPKAPTW